MKAKTALIISSLIMVAGVALTIVYTMEVFTYIIIALGVAFIIPAIVNMVMASTKTSTESENKSAKIQRFSGLISSVGSIIFGVTMIGWSHLYVPFLPMIFGIILILGGSFHLCAMALAFRPTRLPLWLYSMPLVLIAMGFAIIYLENTTLSPQYIVLISGVGLIIFALNAWIELWFMHKITRTPIKKSSDEEVIDVDAVD